MALNPSQDPKSFITFLVAIGVYIFRKPSSATPVRDAFNEAEAVVKEGETRYGKINMDDP